MNILNTIMKLRYGFFCGVVGIGLLSSCNKDFASKLSFDEQPSENKIQGTSYKIAYLVVEGGVGMIASQQASDIGTMPTLGDLSTHAMVSWNGVSTANGDDMTAYADLLTGVEYAKHKVNTAGGSNGLAKYPTLFKYIGDNTDSRMAFISSNSSLAALVKSTDVDNYALQSTDAEVTAKTVEELKRDDAGLVVATFKNVDMVGKASGYGSNAYIAALGDFDKQLKGIVETIEGRKSYSNEKWLIIVTSTKGGSYMLPPDQNDGSIFAQPARNNFVLIYNPQFAFKSYERMQTVDPAWVSSALKYSFIGEGDAKNGQAEAASASLYNLESNKEYTIQFKVKIHQFGKGYPVLISKRETVSGTVPGWGFRMQERASGKEADAGFTFSYQGKSSTKALDIQLESWYTVTSKVYAKDGKRFVQVFVNGEPGGETELASGDIGVSTFPLRVGTAKGLTSGTSSHSIADLRIYETALSNVDILKNYCSTLSTLGSDPYYNSLIGYWPCDDKSDILRDKSRYKRDLILKGTYSWSGFSERSSSLCPTLPDNPEHYVIRSVDVPRLIYAWLNFSGIDRFDLDAQVWNPIFINP